MLEAVGAAGGHRWSITTWPIGGAALAAGLPPLPDATLKAARTADAVLLGAVGDPAYDREPAASRPEAALLALRRELDVFANIRPLRAWPGLEDVSPLKARVLSGTDLVIVRELTGGLYYGEPRGRAADGLSALNTMAYTRAEITRVARVAFDLARRRRRHVTSVDKANVLEVSRLWREVVTDVARTYPDVRLAHEYVDAAAMKLALTPAAFDVVLTENLFGDILSDEAGAIAGSLGLLPSASLGLGPGLFEPVHGSAPSLAGTDTANPVGAIASVAMLLSDGLGWPRKGRSSSPPSTRRSGRATARPTSCRPAPTGRPRRQPDDDRVHRRGPRRPRSSGRRARGSDASTSAQRDRGPSWATIVGLSRSDRWPPKSRRRRRSPRRPARRSNPRSAPRSPPRKKRSPKIPARVPHAHAPFDFPRGGQGDRLLQKGLRRQGAGPHARARGTIVHAEIVIGGSRMMLGDEMPGLAAKAPESLGGTAGGLFIYTPNVDRDYAKAIAAGATPEMPPMNMFWGDRYCTFFDPFGHRWAMATHIEDMSPKEMEKRGAAFFAEQAAQSAPKP